MSPNQTKICENMKLNQKKTNPISENFELCTNRQILPALFTKSPAARRSKQKSLPFTAFGHFPIPLEWYQSKLESHEVSLG